MSEYVLCPECNNKVFKNKKNFIIKTQEYNNYKVTIKILQCPECFYEAEWNRTYIRNNESLV